MSNDKWILCKDRLPELEGLLCFVSIKGECDDGERFEDVVLLRFHHISKDRWVFGNYDNYDICYPDECVAWMPIEWPDPYKEEGGETCTT